MPTEVMKVSYKHTCLYPSKGGEGWVEGESFSEGAPLVWRLRCVSKDFPGHITIRFCPYCGEKLVKP